MSPNAGTVKEFHAVARGSAEDVWAVGQASQQPLTEHWNGTAWSIVPSPSGTGPEAGLLGGAAVSTSDVWAVGDTGSNTLIEQWNGTSWRLVKAPAQAGFLDGSAAVSAGDVWAAGEFLNASHVLDGAAGTNSGQAWAVGDVFNTTSGVQQTLTEFHP
jgi:hypothetical protein